MISLHAGRVGAQIYWQIYGGDAAGDTDGKTDNTDKMGKWKKKEFANGWE